MKKLILMLLLITSTPLFSQWDFLQNNTNGKYSIAENSVLFNGISAGNVQIPMNLVISDTTANWTLLPNQTNGKYSLVTNAVTFMGIDSGLIQIPLTGVINIADIEFDIDTNNFFSLYRTNTVNYSTTFLDSLKFNNGLIYDAGSLTLRTEGDFSIQTVAGLLELNSSSTLTLASATSTNINAVDDINLNAGNGAIVLSSASGITLSNGNAANVFALSNMDLISGGVTPATIDNYLVVEINGTLYDILLKAH